MVQLNLPTYQFRTRVANEKYQIFDILRRKYVALTPEEWVRQNVVQYLIHEKGFPPERMGNEISLKQNGLSRRCDSVLYDRDGGALLIAEFKAPSVPINQQVFDQIARYTWELKVSNLLVSNGLHHFFCRLDYSTMTMEYEKEIPLYEQIFLNR